MHFHATFTPEGPDAKDSITFAEFYAAALERALTVRKKQQAKWEADLVQRRARLAKLKSASNKVMPILASAMSNAIPPDEAGRRIKTLVPDNALRKKLVDMFSKALVATPEQRAKQNRSIARREAKLARDQADLARSWRVLKWRTTAQNGLSNLAKAATKGDLDAAKGLVEAAINAAGLLLYLESQHPELVQPIARAETTWPVLAVGEAGWEARALQRVAKLELGADLQGFKVRFRKARGTDANLPARLWAKAAVRTIEETQFRFLCFRELIRQLGSTMALHDCCFVAGWELGKQPQWLKDVIGLPAFSDESLARWKPLIRKMIREQLPKFHTRPEWANQRNTAHASGRSTPGEIQNAILDDIMSALRHLAPSKDMPKSAC